MEIRQNMAVVIRALKEASGKSLEEFSEDLEISRSSLQNYLSGSRNPNTTTIEHLAKKLNVDVSFLISGAFSDDQLEILLKLLNILKLLSGLSPMQRLRFAELLLEMVALWDEGASHE